MPEPETYPMPPWLAPGQPWPPKDHAERLREIRDWRDLFSGEHSRVYQEHYKRLQDVRESETREPVTLLDFLARLAAARGTYEQEINLPQALSLLWADLLAGQPPKFRAGATVDGPDPGDEESNAIERLTRDLVGEIHEAVIEQSLAGDGVLVVTWRDGRGARVVAYPADQWIPWSATGDPNEPTAHVLFRETSAGGRTMIAVEVHFRGLVRYRRFEVGGGQLVRELEPELPAGVQPDQQLQGLTEFLVQPFPNIASAKGSTGLSDYRAIDTLVSEMDVRASQWGRLFDRYTAPTMYGPDSVLERDPATGQWVYKTAPDGRYIPVGPDDKAPGYLTWDAQLESQLQVWDRLLDIWYTVTGTTPAAFSLFREGGAPSGTALRLRLARPLQVAGRKRERLEPALRRALLAAQQLDVTLGSQKYRPTWPVVDWPDGLPHDPQQAAQTEATRKQAGLTTTQRALMRLDGLSEAEAEQEAKAIAAEGAGSTAPPTERPSVTLPAAEI
ncbi:MAG: phage portal protein [bacterium]|nr:phage portal protein [bacterium]